MVGVHTVMVHSDPAAAGWSAPIASNPYLNSDMAGWFSGPFTPAWSWAGGQVSGGTHLVRSANSPVPRVAAALYRLRVTFSITVEANVYWGVNLGTTPTAASQGPFWMPADSVNLWQGRHLLPGRYTFESTWDPSTVDPRYIYLGPYVQFTNDQVAATVSTCELTYQVGGGVDISCLVDSVSINHGRDDSESQPQASSATINLTSEPVMPLPALVDVGATVTVTTVTNGISSRRFAGRITDMSLGWDEQGENTPDAGVGQLVAVGPLADLGRRVVGAVPFPQELDGARVARVLGAAGVALDPAYSDPGTVQLLPRDIDSQAALAVAQDAAVSANGVLYQTRLGELRYSDADHRRGTTSSLTLDACDVLVTPTWRRTIEGLINEVSLGYGVTPEGSEQPRFIEAAPSSIARWGSYSYTTETALAALADAEAIGRLLLARNSSPVWVMAALPVDVAGLDQSAYEALLGLDMHSLLVLTGLPSLGTAPTSASLWVEGWKETLAWGAHELELVVSGYCRTAPPPRWDDVDPQWTWGDSTLVEQRRNYIADPKLVAAADWSSVSPGGALTYVEGYSANTPGAAPGQVWSVSALFTAAPGVALTGTLYVFGTTDGMFAGNVIGPPTPFTVPAGTSARVVATATLAAPANGLRLYFTGLTGYQGATLTQPLMEKAPTTGAYFDGDTPDTGSADYAWTGTPNASASTESVREDLAGGLPPELTWDMAACLGPPSNLGRWNDQPASLRWDAVAPALTWDTYR